MSSGRSPSMSGRSPSISGRRPSMSGRRPSMSGRRPSLSGRRPSLSGRRPSMSTGRRSSQPFNREKRLSEIQQMKTIVTDETLKSTKEMLKLFDQCEDAGVRTIELLHHQGKQLDHIGGDLEGIDSSLAESNRNMTILESEAPGFCATCCCACCCPPKKKPANIDDEYSLRSGKNAKSDQISKADTALGKKYSARWKGSVSDSAKKKTDEEMEKDIDNNLTLLFDSLGGVKSSAVQMGKIVTAQNSQIDQLNINAAKDQAKLDRSIKRSERLLKKEESIMEGQNILVRYIWDQIKDWFSSFWCFKSSNQ